MKNKLAILVLGLAVSASSAFALTQYVVNGDFAQGLTGWTGLSRTSTTAFAKYNGYVSAYVNSDTQTAVLSNIYSSWTTRKEARGGQPVYQTISIDAPGQYLLSYDTTLAQAGTTPSLDLWIIGNGYLPSAWNGTYRYPATVSNLTSTMGTTPHHEMMLNVPAAGNYTLYFAYSYVTLSPSTATVVNLDNVSVTPVI